MKLAIVSSYIETSGGIRILNETASLMAQSGHTVDWFAPGEKNGGLVGNRIETILYDPRLREDNSSDLQGRDFTSYDIILSDGLAGLHDAELIEHPNKWHLCQMYDRFLFPDDKEIISRLYANCKFIVYSTALGNILKKAYPDCIVKKMPMGVANSRLIPFRDEAKAPNTLVYMVTFRAYVKGTDLVEQVFALAKRDGWTTRLICSVNNHMIDCDEFYHDPPFDIKCRAIAGATISLHTSHFESWCLVVSESMSLGTPVVGTNSRGIKEYATPENSIIIDDRDPEKLWKAIKDLAADSKRYEQIRQSGIETMESLDWSNRKDDYVEFMDQLLL